MNEENTKLSESTPAKPKKKRSFWFLKFLLVLIVFAGGIILGLKLNTMPGPNAILNRYFPTLQATLNPEGQTAEAAPEVTAAPDVTPAPTEAPAEAVPAPAEPEQPAETEAPEAAPAEESSAESVIGGKDEPTGILVSEPTEEEAKPIGIDAALAAALDKAGVEDVDALVYGVYPTETNGLNAYQVDFAAGDTEYMYLVDMFSAEILGWKKVRVTPSYQGTTPTDVFDTMVPDDMAEAGDLVSEEDAQNTALSHAGVRSTVARDLVSELKREGSKVWYEVSFQAGLYKYSYQVDAVSGEILDYNRTK